MRKTILTLISVALWACSASSSEVPADSESGGNGITTGRGSGGAASGTASVSSSTAGGGSGGTGATGSSSSNGGAADTSGGVGDGSGIAGGTGAGDTGADAAPDASGAGEGGRGVNTGDAGTGGSSMVRDGGSTGSMDAGRRADAGTVADAGPSSGAVIRNDVFWKDTSGTPIYSQGGGVLKVGNTYYWYGVKYNGAVAYAGNQRKNSDTSFNAVTIYSSTDLATWKFENDALSAGPSGSMLDPSWLGRLGVAYNANTKKYVLVSQYQGGSAGTGELFATSDTPTGTFVFDHVQPTITNVANGTTGDQTVFVDDDGKAYLVCSSSMGRSNLYVAPLRASDFLNVEPATRIFGGAGREGNAMFKYDGHYYFCSSDLHGWNASHTYCISATNIMGPYSAELVMGNTDLDFSHVTQTGFFVTVNGSAGSTVIFAGDRWADFAGNGIGFNQWCPLTFNGTTPIFQSLSEWRLDVAAGTWSVGSGNNYALNPSFEADRVAVTQPAGWTTSTNLSGAAPFANGSGGHTGNWNWTLSYTAPYQAALGQKIAGLPSGTYTLSVWVKSSGGQSVAEVYAKNFGGTELDHSVDSAMNAWSQISIPGIAVSNGQCEIGVTTTASANQSVSVDDWSLVRTGP